MNNRKIFSKGIYKESFREMKIVGIIFASVSIVLTLGYFLVNLVGSNFNAAPKLVDSYTISGFGLILVYITAPILAFKIYGYVNTRCASDFYHSLPYTRECVYVSSYLAIMTWLFAILVTTFAAGVAAYSLFPSVFYLSFGDIAYDFVSLLSMILLVVSAISVAVSLTGNRFMNILVSVLLLFVPRAFINVVVSIFVSNAPVIAEGSLPTIISSKCNLVYSGFSRFLIGSGSSISAIPVVYTFALAVVYGIIACILFKHRKSETAHLSSTTPLLQAFFRIIFAVFLCLWTFPLIDSSGFESSYIVWYGIVAVLYFAVELITTKKWKNVLRAVPGLFIVAAVSCCILFGMKATATAALSYEPDASEIESVRILSLSDSYADSGLSFSNATSEYFCKWATEKSSDIEIEDKEVIDIVAASLKNSNRDAKNNSFRTLYNGTYMTVSIRTSNGEKERLIKVSSSGEAVLMGSISKNEKYRENFLTLPESDSISLTADRKEDIEISREVYDAFREEISDLDFIDWYEFLESDIGFDSTLMYFNIIVKEPGKIAKTIIVPFDYTVAPETFSKVLNESLFNRSEAKMLVERLENTINYAKENGLDEYGNEYVYCYITSYFYNYGYCSKYNIDLNFEKYNKNDGGFYSGKEFGNDAEEALEMLKKTVDSEFDETKYAVVYLMSCVGDADDEALIDTEMTVYVPIDDGLQRYFRTNSDNYN